MAMAIRKLDTRPKQPLPAEAVVHLRDGQQRPRKALLLHVPQHGAVLVEVLEALFAHLCVAATQGWQAVRIGHDVAPNADMILQEVELVDGVSRLRAKALNAIMLLTPLDGEPAHNMHARTLGVKTLSKTSSSLHSLPFLYILGRKHLLGMGRTHPQG